MPYGLVSSFPLFVVQPDLLLNRDPNVVLAYDQLRDILLKARNFYRGEGRLDDYDREIQSEEVVRLVAEKDQRIAVIEEVSIKKDQRIAVIEEESIKKDQHIAVMESESIKKDQYIPEVEQKIARLTRRGI